ncbi:MAG: MerR family transcriptional regulator [Solirubrobacteraceae bacterium]
MSTVDSDSTPRLRIGELAALADTTTRTIRHYHARSACSPSRSVMTPATAATALRTSSG